MTLFQGAGINFVTTLNWGDLGDCMRGVKQLVKGSMLLRQYNGQDRDVYIHCIRTVIRMRIRKVPNGLQLVK